MKTVLIHVALFVATFLTTTLAGVQWLNKDATELTNFSSGLSYSILLLTVLMFHEFGHYLAAKYHRVEATYPFFIPFLPILGFGALNPFGTLGAVIRLKTPIPSRRALFDIGASGPLAGFVASALILMIGFITLPGRDYLYAIHPEYVGMDTIPQGGWTFGTTLFYTLASYLAPQGSFIPPMNELYHYPALCVGWFGLLVTAINLLPVGQLDGGHITYAMFGSRHFPIARITLIVLIVMGVAGFLPLIEIDPGFGYAGWLFWAVILIVFLKVLKFGRPPLLDETPLSQGRIALGWVCIAIFFGSFSPVPITIPF